MSNEKLSVVAKRINKLSENSLSLKFCYYLIFQFPDSNVHLTLDFLGFFLVESKCLVE